MNIDKKAGHIDPKVALSQAEHEKGTVPGLFLLHASFFVESR